MHKEIRRIKVTCDNCRLASVIVETEDDYAKLPDGWFNVDHHDCGSTGYSKTEVTCTTCVSKHGREWGKENIKPVKEIYLSKW